MRREAGGGRREEARLAMPAEAFHAVSPSHRLAGSPSRLPPPASRLLGAAAWHAVMLLACAFVLIPIVMEIPADALRRGIERVHTLGPILDPTAYQRGMGNLDASAALVRAVLAFQREIRACPAIVAALNAQAAPDAD